MKMSQRGNVFSLSDILLGCSSASGQSRTANLVAKVMGTVHIIKFFQKIIFFQCAIHYYNPLSSTHLI